MATLAELAGPYHEKFKALSAVALPEDAPLVHFMAVHEGAMIRIARLEATDCGAMDLELLPMLAYPLARPIAGPEV
jgi:hypothetical protein